MLKGRFDMHTHTTASDGVFTPAGLVHMAYELGLSGLAITDHDTLHGLDEAGDAIAALNMRLLPGVELSCEYAFSGGPAREVHMLGYFIEKPGEELYARLAELQAYRWRRGQKILDILAALGMDIRGDWTAAYAENGSLGRGLIGRKLVEAGYAADTDEAFDRWLSPGKPACVPRLKLAAAEAIELLHRNGAVAVLAHPVQIGDDRLIKPLAEAGLDGMECSHPDHNTAQEQHYRNMARELKLAVSGGSDCHTGELGSHTATEQELAVLLGRYCKR